jgi:hypothetical protein
MDVKDFLNRKPLTLKTKVELSGWLIDTKDGLFLLGDHSPQDYDYPYRLKIGSLDFMHPILKKVPTLVGGESLLFYRAKIIGVFSSEDNPIIESLSVQIDRSTDRFDLINISQECIAESVRLHGEYKFQRPRESARDWLDDA